MVRAAARAHDEPTARRDQGPAGAAPAPATRRPRDAGPQPDNHEGAAGDASTTRPRASIAPGKRGRAPGVVDALRRCRPLVTRCLDGTTSLLDAGSR